MKRVGGAGVVTPKSAVTVDVGTAFASDDLGLTFYNSAPQVEVSVREFEEYSRDRLRVLHAIDRACAYEQRLSSMEDVKSKVKPEVLDCGLFMEYPSGIDANTFAERKLGFERRDSVSHFALRLAFCKTRDAREWFLKQEQRLFIMRYENLKAEAQEVVIAWSGVKCKKFVDTAPSNVNFVEIQKATAAARIFKEGKAPEYDQNFYLMPFYEVDPKLISSRRVVVQGGMAYVPSIALKSILAKKFKDNLAATLEVAFQGLPTALADPRIGSFIRDLQEYGMHLLVAQRSNTNTEDVGEQLTMANFEELMLRSFPPCMRRVIEKQREMKKHLKHAGRLQLRPFLKECGFTIEDSFAWWKKELTKDPTIDATSFEKNYTYDLEHAYGKKGHHQGQNSFGCAKLIGFPAEGANQVHGCPFKCMDVPQLKQQMHQWKVPERNVFEMEKLISQGNHYQLACIEFFKAFHEENEGARVGNSPGDYFRDSCGFHKAKKEKQAASAPTGNTNA